jgi:hypothetical protein
MGEAAAKRTAQPDRVMRDIRYDGGKQGACGPRHHRTMKRRVTHACRNREHVAIDRKPIETGHSVDINEVSGSRHAECHHRHEALTAGKNAAIEWAEFSELRHCVVDSFRRVINKRRGFHWIIIPVGRSRKRESSEGIVASPFTGG